MKIPFILPPLAPHSQHPTWEGNNFRIGNQVAKILEYSENLQGWNDNLTSFHEQTAGDHHFIDKASRQYALDQLNRHAPSKPLILEIGCSSGFMLKTILKARPDAALIGADVVYEPLLKLSEELPQVPLMRFDLLHCPLPDHCIDAVVMLNVLEHIEDDALALKQIHRILKPNGILIIEVPAGPHLYDAYDKALMHYRRYAMSNLVTLAQKQNFSILKKSHLGFFLYPGFKIVKKKNQRRLVKPENQQQLVKQHINQTGNSQLLHALMQTELKLGRFLNYPIGIRCLLTCQKTQAN